MNLLGDDFSDDFGSTARHEYLTLLGVNQTPKYMNPRNDQSQKQFCIEPLNKREFVSCKKHLEVADSS